MNKALVYIRFLLPFIILVLFSAHYLRAQDHGYTFVHYQNQDQVQAPTDSYHIKLYDGGSVVDEWDASDVSSVGCGSTTFTDSRTQKEIQVTGTMVIEKER